MLPRFSKEELLTNAELIAYCKNPTPELEQWWKAYLLQYPEEWQNLEEAKLLLSALQEVLLQEQKKEDLERLRAVLQGAGNSGSQPGKWLKANARTGKWILAAAAVLLPFMVYFLGLQYWEGKTASSQLNAEKKQDSIGPLQVITAADQVKIIATDAAGKKTIRLPDGSLVILNKNSSLHLKENFSGTNREVYLAGEGYFDVVHDKKNPFVVHVNEYDVKVHGTAFNVRAYPGDSVAETALLRGSVEVVMNNAPKGILLKPHEKLVVHRQLLPVLSTDSIKNNLEGRPEILRIPITVSSDGTTILETFWTRKVLEIPDESFYQFREKMEHWYNVKIELLDEEVSAMRFRAKFQEETIEEALEALQLTNTFKFSINDKVVRISKK
ncbi:FecR family protein [Flavihumibacter sp. CACIAM 22H1]|uniref:FecR family protein n=1 Tax=Flavihumibacter sp. CACIAM 22H1 TaxID=1812911 RepID=UPI0007A8D601|nr:FecR family protein [Flavihumibacter sp. CACIAM 22H1]KYP16608.1 MAG: hypothetical protein A1D16_09345 [Flavihumibacter sp. CACIAM 22H1]